MKTNSFRVWLQEIWMQHKDEYADIGQLVPEQDSAAYFQKYKYWLRREYRYRMKANNV